MNRKLPSYIAVEGPIGVGKTSLARRLADELQAELLLEQPQENPFLERFYADPVAAALPTQLCFLMQRIRQVQSLRQGDIFNQGRRVSDFLMQKDQLFAGITLAADEYALYDQVYQQLALDAPVPDLVIYLQAPVEVLLERIQRRGRAYERRMDSAYLQRLCDAYASFFYHFDDAPLLIVNATAIDWVNRDSDFRQLVDFMATARAGRHYFNPLPFSM